METRDEKLTRLADQYRRTESPTARRFIVGKAAAETRRWTDGAAMFAEWEAAVQLAVPDPEAAKTAFHISGIQPGPLAAPATI